jgi:hypothetical protein
MTPDQAANESLDDASLTPEQSLALIEAQRARVEAQTDVNPVVLYGVWGIAWLLGFGLWAVTDQGDGGSRLLDIPRGVVGTVFGLLIAGAMAATMWHSIRASRGLRGREQLRGAMYGWSWTLAFAALFVVMAGIDRAGAPQELTNLLWPLLSCLLAGVMQTMGGAVWNDVYLFGIGIWILVCTAVGGFLGLPGFNVLMALAGGGGFLVMAAWFGLRRRR